MDKFMQQMREAFANEALWKEFQTGIWDTIYSTVAATLVACVLGIILGIILVAGEEDGVRPLPGPVMKVLNFAINILRSVPFLILMIMVLPLSELLVGTTIGTVASIPPLIIASASFVARLVETSLREVDKGVIEAAQSMGCSPFQIIWKVILPESLPSLVASFTTAFITILATAPWAGAIAAAAWQDCHQLRLYKYNYAVCSSPWSLLWFWCRFSSHWVPPWPPGRTTASPTGLGEESSVGTSAGRSTGTSAAPAACEFWRGRQSSCFARPLFLCRICD